MVKIKKGKKLKLKKREKKRKLNRSSTERLLGIGRVLRAILRDFD